ncbi:MAG: hypothetical protein K6B39_07295 [Lachnospiraceae bacterium]|nr:hypothetical protein [Lachnospiraceae bacterium]
MAMFLRMPAVAQKIVETHRFYDYASVRYQDFDYGSYFVNSCEKPLKNANNRAVARLRAQELNERSIVRAVFKKSGKKLKIVQ